MTNNFVNTPGNIFQNTDGNIYIILITGVGKGKNTLGLSLTLN